MEGVGKYIYPLHPHAILGSADGLQSSPGDHLSPAAAH